MKSMHTEFESDRALRDPSVAAPARSRNLAAGPLGVPLVTRFGDMVDVRNRGGVRIGRFAGSQPQARGTPAVVRVWHAEQCKELSVQEARAFAAQLFAAAALVETQNNSEQPDD